MTLRVVVFGEDILGVTLASDLCDRVVVERGPRWLADLWGERTLLEGQRSWTGVAPTEAWTKWTSLRSHDRRHHSTHGLGMKGYALVAYRAAHIAARLAPVPDVVVFCIDTQGDPGMRRAMQEGVRRADAGELSFAFAVAHQESEAWVVTGFVPENAGEADMLRLETREQGFDPTAAPQRLTPNRSTDPHDAKRVVAALIPEGTLSPRARRCWLDRGLVDLEQRGRETGLPEYLADISDVVLSLLAPAQRKAMEGGADRGES